VAREHLEAVVVGRYLEVLGLVGLLCLLAHLRQALDAASGDRRAATVFWATGLPAAATLAAGGVHTTKH